MKPTQDELNRARVQVQAAKTRHFNLAATIVFAMLATVIVVGAVFLYWLYAPSQVIKFNKYPIPIRTISPPPPANGVIVLKTDYCKLIDAAGPVRTSFVSVSREIFLPMGEEKSEKGCVNREIAVIIPTDIPPDTYHIHFRINYKINPITHSTEEYNSKQFKIE